MMSESNKSEQLENISELDEENNNKAVVMVTGCSGKVGSAVVKYLSKHHSDKVRHTPKHSGILKTLFTKMSFTRFFQIGSIWPKLVVKLM